MLPLVALATLSSLHLQSGSGQQKYSDWRSLYDLADGIRKDYKLPAIGIAYQKGDEKLKEVVAGVRAAGEQSGQVQLDDRLLVGSVGKVMTATLVARLIEQEKFGWKTTLAQALPGVKMRDEYKSVTIEQLLHNTSPLPALAAVPMEDVKKMADAAGTATAMRKAFVENLLAQAPTNSALGLVSNSDAGYVVAGYIAEKVIRQSYEWLMKRYVFNAMKMPTGLIEPVGSEGQVGSQNNVYGHLQSDFGFSPYEMPGTKMDWVMAPAGGGISCSVGDLTKFLVWHLKGMKGDAQVLTADSYHRLHTPIAGEAAGKVACGWTIDSPLTGAPCQSFSSTDGAFCTDVALWPDKDLVTVAITNAGVLRRPMPTLLAILAIRDRFEKPK